MVNFPASHVCLPEMVFSPGGGAAGCWHLSGDLSPSPGRWTTSSSAGRRLGVACASTPPAFAAPTCCPPKGAVGRSMIRAVFWLNSWRMLKGKCQKETIQYEAFGCSCSMKLVNDSIDFRLVKGRTNKTNDFGFGWYICIISKILGFQPAHLATPRKINIKYCQNNGFCYFPIGLVHAQRGISPVSSPLCWSFAAASSASCHAHSSPSSWANVQDIHDVDDFETTK